MTRLYFTFGSDPKYPYGLGDYILVFGRDKSDCINTFRDKYPNRPGSNAVNCAEFYTKAQWEKISEEHFKSVEPKEILRSKTLYGEKPEGFGDIWFWVPSCDEIVCAAEGTGDNLLPEDIEEGYVDYLELAAYRLENGQVEESDGGELMLPYMVQEHYTCLADAIPDILEFLYNFSDLDAQILQPFKEDE